MTLRAASAEGGALVSAARSQAARSRPAVCIVQPERDVPSETFLRAHAERLPAKVTVLHGAPAWIEGRPVLSERPLARRWRQLRRLATNRAWRDEIDRAYAVAFRRSHAQAVLAEYGPMGVQVLPACRSTGIPLIVHFHGYDASRESVIREHASGYRALFADAAALVAVSMPMKEALLALGAPEAKLHVNACGVDCAEFRLTDAGANPLTFLATGRFVEKKGPHLTLLAFAEAHRTIPGIRLRMIGEGPLLPLCEQMARALGLQQVVTFLGSQPHERVGREMQAARAFLQHSIRAGDGDTEGTPVAVLEAQASGLPVVATRHGGIPAVVLDGRTGFLVEEGDVGTMARRIERLAEDGPLATTLGSAGRCHVIEHFTMKQSISRLWEIIEAVIQRSR